MSGMGWETGIGGCVESNKHSVVKIGSDVEEASQVLAGGELPHRWDTGNAERAWS